ncbi:MAG: 4Fe-4S binding protein [Firmicutes bacterium]|nr:4Fe-4S binding protein [Bacillota bacterium]MBV1728606.1 4Fe-4S binding protein [Desulforudis sp.]MBU4533694.1 4Fe-4S binding protein [Bacillota bacterium]MBU4554795.1 4Fe-4S binding protein [Bacillota bacterium]MBV1735900.1 4Fe-4S binding protein [Desulforudis sp.]
MAIDITAGPRTGNYVGCGVCVEVCPQQALPIPAKDPNLPA